MTPTQSPHGAPAGAPSRIAPHLPVAPRTARVSRRQFLVALGAGAGT